MNWQSHAIDLLAASLVRPFALVAAAGLILRVFKVRHPASRHAVWMSVLIGMLLLPVVAVVAPRWKLPLLPLKQEAVIEPHAIPPVSPNLNYERRDFALNPVAPSDTTKFALPEPRTLALWAYLVGLLAMVAYRVMGWAILRLMVARSTPVSARRVRESNDILTPVTVGVLRPLVLLPPEWRDWQPKVRRAVLAHEFAHIRRRDTLLLSLTRLAKCVYWFHPLAWWISRQVSNLAELSCDAIALEKFGDPAGYSRILLDFATTVDQAGYRLALPGLAMASGSGISRRVEQIFELAGGNLKRLSGPGILLVLAGVPVMCLAAVVELSAPAARVFSPIPVNIVPVKAPPPVMEAQSRPPAPPQSKPTPPAPGPKFDAASIKPCRAADVGPGRGSGGGPPVGRLHIPCMTADELIGRAYRAEGSAAANSPRGTPIEGGPGWIHSDRYAIDAEADGNATEQTMWGPMMRALLGDRFQLKVHLATNDIPVYALTVAKDGPKLQPFQDGECTQHVAGAPQPGPDDKPWCGIGGMRTVRNGRNVTWDVRGASFLNFATFFSVVLDRPVVDRTGISGMFDFHLEFAPDETMAARPSPFSPDPNALLADPVGGPSIFTAFQQQLGLRLEPARGTGESIVIDRIEKPSEN